MNWNTRYAAETPKQRKWISVGTPPTTSTPSGQPSTTSQPGRQRKFTPADQLPTPVQPGRQRKSIPVEPIGKTLEGMSQDWSIWSAIKLPGAPAGKKVTGFTGEVTDRGGGSAYTVGSDGKYSKTLSPEAQEKYRKSRPDRYGITDAQGRYTEKWDNTVFIHPGHKEGINRMLGDRSPVAVRGQDGSVQFHARDLIRGLPSSHVINVDGNGSTGVYRIPENHISTTPFRGAVPFQYGNVTFADGSSESGHHMGNSVGQVHYE